MLELLFLLLPIAVAYGWYMGKRSVRFEKHQEEERISRDFVTGINFLLSDQKEQALELFSALAKEKGDDFEAHLTLANLLRTRGQIDSALQIHESIVASELLTYEQRLLSKQHLGKTYLQAGLLDRAEDIFISLLNEDEYKIIALKQLVIIYQSTREWELAISYANKLIKEDRYYRTSIAHFYCELAQKAETNNQTLRFIDNINAALSYDRNCARATLLVANFLKKRTLYLYAIFFYQNLMKQDPLIVLEALVDLDECYENINTNHQYLTAEDEALLTKLNLDLNSLNIMPRLDFLRACVVNDIGSDAHIHYINHLLAQDQFDTAFEHLKSTIFNRPTLKLLKTLITLQLTQSDNSNTQSSLKLLGDIINEQIITKPRYRCQKCGFSAYSLYWHCPSCREWASINLIKGIDGQ